MPKQVNSTDESEIDMLFGQYIHIPCDKKYPIFWKYAK